MSHTTTRNAAATVLTALALAGGGLAVAQPASAAQRPANDLLSRAENLTPQGCDATTDGSNVSATGQAFEPLSPFQAIAPPVQSVWFKWRSPVSDTVVIDTQGSGFDTILGAYTGSALNVVQANDDSGDLTSEVSFEARRNVTYKIAVDGFAAAAGDYVLNITC
jgi:hypothetical protein